MAKTAKTKTAKEPAGNETVTVNIRTKGNHTDYLDWCLDQLPDPYSYYVKIIDGGYKVSVEAEKNGNKFFVCRYLANLAMEIKTLDEGNVQVEKSEKPITAEVESAE